MCSLLALLLLAAPDDAELFIDKGDTYVRAGSDSGLQRGTSLTVVAGKDRRRIGTATVMEVWPALARVSLDEAARADKTASRYVSLGKKSAVPEPSAPPPPPPPPPAEGKRAPLPTRSSTVEDTPIGLVGHAIYAGAGPWMALQLWNDSNVLWTRCTLTLLPMKSTYYLAELRAQDRETIARSNFTPEVESDPEFVRVKCMQGEKQMKLNE